MNTPLPEEIIQLLKTNFGEFASDPEKEGQMVTYLKKWLDSQADGYQKIFLDSPEATFVHNFETITHVNNSFEELSGYAREELIGNRDMMSIVFDEDQALINQLQEKLLKNGSKANCTVKLLQHNGNTLPVRLNMIVIRLNNKDHVQIIVTDITEQQILENKNMETEVKYREIVNSLCDILVRVNSDGIVDLISPSVQKMGYKPEDIVGKPAIDFYVDPNHRDLYLAEIRKNGFCDNFQTSLYNKQGDVIHILATGKLYLDQKGKYGIESLFRDNTEQKEMQRMKEEFTKSLEAKVKERTMDLESARKKLAMSLDKERELGVLKTQFVAMASHQFRTPMSVIQANVGIMEMLKEDISEELRPRFQTIYERISSQISRMTSLMDDVLVLGKIDSGKVITTRSSVDLVELCQSVAVHCNHIQPDKRNVKISTDGRKRLIELDPKLMEHALLNLMNNAFKYSSGRPSPEMNISFDEEVAMVTITDFGIGIPDAEMESIFEPFGRASNVQEIAGTGLGMSIAKEYIELNSGELIINSTVDQGTVCKIILAG